MTLCRKCNQGFDITPEDRIFYEKVSPVFKGKKECIPPPTLCPRCREQRRMAWRNERKWYNATCESCHRSMISIYRPESGYHAFCRTCWWGEKFDPMTYGIPYTFSRDFRDQFLELEKKIPHLALMNDDGVQSENCEYTQDFAYGKNCYLVIGSWNVRDSLYSHTINRQTNDAVDCEYVNRSQYIYECQYSDRIYNGKFLRNCESCTDCTFGFDLRGCKDCFGCVGLRQKQYCFFNRQYSAEEYRRKIVQIDLGSHTTIQKIKQEFAAMVIQVPHRAVFINNCQNSLGDNLIGCKDSYGFDLFESRDCRYYTRSDQGESSYDIFQSGKPSWCYEGLTPDESYMSCFDQWTWKCKHVFYSDNCHSSEHLFGCVGLKRAKYCILNKQYSKEEYEVLVPRIIEQMRKEGMWGEFFDPSLSPFGYNETVAMEYYPLQKEEALRLGFTWSDYVPPPPAVSKIVKASQLPDSIEDVPDEILQWAIECEVSGRPFTIIKQELQFYRDHHLPLPRRHPDIRHLDRMKLRNPRKLFSRQCSSCSMPITTTYAPERPERVYCEPCYLKEVY